MTELFDEEGNAIEAFTKEEVEAKTAEVAKTYEEKVAALSQDLEKEKEKEKNFAALRAKKDELTEAQKQEQAKIQVTMEQLEQKISEAQNAGVSKVLELQRESVINDLAGGDAELKIKIEANYKLISKPEGTAEEIAARARDAYLLSMDINHEDLFGNSSVNAPSGPGRAVGAGTGTPVSQDLQDVGRKFGISDADWKKFGK
jgi:hypothetical protein